MTNFDSFFPVIWPEQQEMVSMEEIIQLQKKEEAAQKAAAEKERQAAQKAATVIQGPPVIQAQSAAKKGKKKGITINEGAPQVAKTVPFDNAPQSKKDGKKRVGEQAEAPPATRQCTGPGGTVAMVLVSVSEVTDSTLVIHPHPLFGGDGALQERCSIFEPRDCHTS